MGITIPTKPALIFLIPGIFEQVVLSHYDDSKIIEESIPEQYKDEINSYFCRCLSYGGSNGFKLLVVGDQNYQDYDLLDIGASFYSVGVIPLFPLAGDRFEEISNFYNCSVEIFSAGYTKG